MPEPNRLDHVFSQVAVKNRLLTKKEARDAIADFRDSADAGTLAEHLVLSDILSARSVRKVERAVRYRELRLDSKLYGRIAIKSGLATASEMQECLALQKRAYQKRETPPDIGDLLMRRGLNPDADVAVRNAMADLDRDEYVAKKIASLTEVDAITDDAVGDDSARAPRAKKSTRRIRRKGSKPARGRKGKRERTKPAPKKRSLFGRFGRKKKEEPEVEPDSVDELDGLDAPNDDTPDPADSEGALDSDGAPQSEDDLGDDLGEPEDDDEPVPLGLESARRPRLDETSDTIAALMGPKDLELDGATGSTEEDLTDSDEDGHSLRSDLDDLDDLEDDLGDLGELDDLDHALPMADFSGPSDTTKIAIDSGPLECPKCNVTLETGTSQCLYCGHSFGELPQTGGSGSPAPLLEEGARTEGLDALEDLGFDSGAIGDSDASGSDPIDDSAAYEQDSDEQDSDDGGVRDVALAEAFPGAMALVETPRGTVFRADGAWIFRLPLGVEPTDEQVETFVAAQHTLNALDVRQLLPFRWLGRADDETFAVYADDGGIPALLKIENGAASRKQTARIVKQVAVALGAAHEASVLCHELRPAMVLCPEDDSDEPVRVFAVGIVGLLTPPAGGVPEADPDDTFMPPERRRKAGRAEIRTDLFGLGALLLLLVTGEAPTGDEPKKLPNVPGAMKTFLKKTLAGATGMRYLDTKKCFFDLNRCPGAKGWDVETSR